MDSYEHNPANHTGQPSAWDIPYDPERDRFLIPKALNTVAAVYLIENAITGRRYVGSSGAAGRRINRHLNTTPRNPVIRADLEAHGRQSFRVSILELATSLDGLEDLEHAWIKRTLPEYNNHHFGGAGHAELAPEARAKISAANSRRRHSAETREKIGRSQIGRVGPMTGKGHTDETRARMKAAQQGCKRSPEHVAAMKAGHEQRRERRETEAAWMLAIMIHCGVIAG